MMANEIYCERCGERLREDRAVWLELNTRTLLYHQKDGEVPPEESQGSFSFGKACARTQLRMQVAPSGRRS